MKSVSPQQPEEKKSTNTQDGCEITQLSIPRDVGSSSSGEGTVQQNQSPAVVDASPIRQDGLPHEIHVATNEDTIPSGQPTPEHENQILSNEDSACADKVSLQQNSEARNCLDTHDTTDGEPVTSTSSNQQGRVNRTLLTAVQFPLPISNDRVGENRTPTQLSESGGSVDPIGSARDQYMDVQESRPDPMMIIRTHAGKIGRRIEDRWTDLRILYEEMRRRTLERRLRRIEFRGIKRGLPPSISNIAYYHINPTTSNSGNRSSHSSNSNSNREEIQIPPSCTIELFREDSTLVGPDRDCPICLEEYDHSNNIVTLPCGHIFHESCFQLHLQRKSECPICRRLIC